MVLSPKSPIAGWPSGPIAGWSIAEIPYRRSAYQAVLSPVGPIAGIPIAGFR